MSRKSSQKSPQKPPHHTLSILSLIAATLLFAGMAHGQSVGTVTDTTAASIAKGLPTGPNGNKSAIGSFTPGDMQSKLSDGLAIWRTQRKDINGIAKGACASCHSSDGLELALWDFHDDDVRRRAHLDGTSAADREKLVNYFAALRQKYGVKTLKNVLNDRPLQPQGRPFDGATKADRDYAFAQASLRTSLPTLYNGDLSTLALAIKAKNEIKASNPLVMRMGIPLPRLSEDCFRGTDHCISNDWIADLPRIPRPEREAEWFALNDAYIANPSNQNLRNILIAVDSMTRPWLNPGQASPGAAATLGTDKFKSVQILQHLLRRQQLNLYNPYRDTNPMALVSGPLLSRPLFPSLVGDFAFNHDGIIWEHPQDMPNFVRTSLGESPARPLTDDDVENQKAQMSIPWWYTGFLLDTALGTGTNTEYFFGALGVDPQGGYPFHRYYAIGKNGTATNDRNTTPAQTAAYNLAFAKTAWKDVGSDDWSRLYPSATARQVYRKLEMSWTLMWMQLMKAQIQQSGLASLDKHFDIDINLCAPNGFNSLRQWVITSSGMDGTRTPFAFSLYNELNAMANCGLTPLPSSYIPGTGTGLTVDWYKGSGDESNGKSAWLVGSPKLGSRVEPIIDFPGREDGQGYLATWTKSIGASVQEDAPGSFSSRATGYIQAPVSGNYDFVLGGGYGKVFVNNKEVYNEFRYNDGSPLKVSVTLSAGQRYPIIIERHGYAPGGMQLTWRSLEGGLPTQKIPTSQFSPN